MFENIRVSLYGTRAEVDTKSKPKSNKGRAKAPTVKKYIAIPSSDIKNAKAFHIFYRKSPSSKWVRLTDELSVFSSINKSNASKRAFIDLETEFWKSEKFPEKKIKEPSKEEPPKKEPPKKEPPKKEPSKKEPPEKVPPEEETFEQKGGRSRPEKPKKKIELELPKLPSEPRVVSTRRQVIPKLALIIYNELDARGISWPEKRIDNMLKKLWRGFSKHPHLLTSDEFRRNIVTKEIVEQTRKERKEATTGLQDKFRKELTDKEISLDPSIVKGSVKVQIKEVFNKLNLEDENDQTRTVFDEKLNKVEIDRQILFVQIVAEYDEFIQVGADDIESGQEMLMDAINKVKRDVTKIFNEALDKGVFSYSEGPQYSIRLLTPMIDVRGEVPRTYIDRKGNQTSGNGFSTTRHEINDLDDLDDLIDELFSDLPKILARYVALNSALGVGFTGFVLERILR